MKAFVSGVCVASAIALLAMGCTESSDNRVGDRPGDRPSPSASPPTDPGTAAGSASKTGPAASDRR